MKKLIALVLALVCVSGFVGCVKNDTHQISITIPAGSTEAFVYSDEEILATGKKITIFSGERLGDTEVILSPVNENVEAGYVATYLTPGVPVEFDAVAVQGEWFKIGVSVQNDTDTDKIVYVEVDGVEMRIG